MASTYENDLRLEEMATGENSGSWGTKTNTNLELIADAFSYGTETIADADTTITIADGAADAARSLALKINSSADLTTTRVVTLAPNTTSKVWIIENNTSGGQTLTISAGSGSNITLANGKTKIIATDGIGAGSNVVELTQDLAIADLFVDDDLTVGDDIIMNSDGGILKIGADADLQVTHSGSEGTITNATGDLTVDVAGDIILDADGSDFKFRDGGAGFFTISNSSLDAVLKVEQSNEDFIIKGNDGGVEITALTLDMSEAGAATFNAGVTLSGDLTVDTDTLYVDSANNLVGVGTASPSHPLTIQADGTSGNSIKIIGDSTNNSGRIMWRNSADTAEKGRIAVDTSSDMTFHSGGGSEAMRIDSSQRVLIGATSTRTVDGYNQHMLLEGAGITKSSFAMINHTNDSNGAYFYLSKARGTTIGGSTIVQDGDVSGAIVFTAADGTDMTSKVAQIQANVDGTPGSNDMPGRLQFYTTADGASVVTERMRINNAGDVKIGSGDPTERLHVDGEVRVEGQLGTNLYVRDEPRSVSPTNIGSSIGLKMQVSDRNGNASWAGVYAKGSDAFQQGNSLYFITQTTTGSEPDFTNGNIPSDVRMTIDRSGRVLIGATSNTAIGGHNAATQIVGSGSYHEATLTIQGNENNSNGAYLGFSSSRGTTAGSTTIVQDDDTLGQVYFAGADGTDLGSVAAAMTAQVDGTPGSNDMPGRLIFSTASDGSASLTERMRLDSSGQLTLYSNRLQINGGDSASNHIRLRRGTAPSLATFYADIGYVLNGSGNAEALRLGTGSSSDAIQFYLGDGNLDFVFESDPQFQIRGDVSIGSNTPTYRGNIIIADSGGSETAAGGIEFHSSSGGGAGYGVRMIADANANLFTQIRSNSASWTRALNVTPSGSGAAFKISTESFTSTAHLGMALNTAGTAAIRFTVSNNEAWTFDNRNGSGTYQIDFRWNNVESGRIDVTSSAVAYQTSSDYRLKENVTDITDGIDTVKQLQPKRYNFIANSDHTETGFIAHEIKDVLGHVVSGEKDATVDVGDIRDANGDLVKESCQQPSVLEEGQTWTYVQTVPKYQQLDYARLTPILTAALKEAVAKIEALEARVAALETS